MNEENNNNNHVSVTLALFLCAIATTYQGKVSSDVDWAKEANTQSDHLTHEPEQIKTSKKIHLA